MKNPAISFITPVYNDEKGLKSYIGSIVDQDFENWELILVDDGSTDKSWEVIQKSMAKDKRIRGIQIKHAGACVARNTGFKMSSGKYISHLPADSFLFPGMARIWVESLDQYPEYAFLYGGYRFGPPLGLSFMSQQFDKFILTQYNYIDGSFPYRREFFPEWNNGGWDPNIKSLQDWDFYLAIVLGDKKLGIKGGKGLYRPEVMFETEPPHKGGLSEDSSQHWEERVKQIKDKWGIPINEIVVTSPGAPFHGMNIAKILKQDYQLNPGFKPHSYKMIYLLGFYPSIQQQCVAAISRPDGQVHPARKVIHWIGSDIWQLQHASWTAIQQLKQSFDSHSIIHICEFEQTRKELADLGINAKIIPLPPKKLYPLFPFPSGKFTVGIYSPNQNKEFYFDKLMTEVAHELPQFKFLFYGDRLQSGKNKNITYAGYIDKMDEFIKMCHATVRLTQHDGLPLSLVEFVLAGRNALFNINLPFMNFVDLADKELIKQKIVEMSKQPLNRLGSDYWRKEMDHGKYRERIMELLNETGYIPEEFWKARSTLWMRQAPIVKKIKELPHIGKVKELLKEVKFKSVIDIGCGNGRWYPFFAGKEYTGIDISEYLISAAKQYFPEGKFVVSTPSDVLPEFDLGFSYTTLEHIPVSRWPETVMRLKQSCKYLLLVEPENITTRDYCINHDYRKDFNVIKFEILHSKDTQNDNLTIMLIKNK